MIWACCGTAAWGPILIIVWQLLTNPDATFNDLGPDHYDRRICTTARTRTHIRGLQALGDHVTLQRAA